MNLAELYYVGKVLQECATSGMHTGRESSSLSIAETVVVEALHAAGPSAIGVIAQRTGYAQSQVSTVVSTLQARSLLTVQTDPNDRRRTIVDLSDLAMEEARQISAQDARPVLEATLSCATNKQLDLLIQAARTVLRLADPEPQGSRPLADG